MAGGEADNDKRQPLWSHGGYGTTAPLYSWTARLVAARQAMLRSVPSDADLGTVSHMGVVQANGMLYKGVVMLWTPPSPETPPKTNRFAHVERDTQHAPPPFPFLPSLPPRLTRAVRGTCQCCTWRRCMRSAVVLRLFLYASRPAITVGTVILWAQCEITLCSVTGGLRWPVKLRNRHTFSPTKTISGLRRVAPPRLDACFMLYYTQMLIGACLAIR